MKVFDDFDECLAEYERVRPWVLNSLWYENSGMTEREVMEAIGRRKMILATIDNAFALFSICHSDEHVGFATLVEDEDQFLLLHLIGGRMNQSLMDIFNALGEIEQYAKQHNCKRISAVGRKGWKRIVEKHGFRTETHNEFENMYIKEVY